MKFVLKKTAGLLFAVFIVSISAFAAFEIIPGSPARTILGTEASEETVAALEAQMGLDRPLAERYVRWAKDFVAGDMGVSYFYRIPVKQMILDKLPVTLSLSAMAFAFIMAISLLAGILSVKYADRSIDRFLLVTNQITMSVPPFFTGVIFTAVFGLTFKMFVPGGYVSYTDDIGGFLRYLIFPALALALPKAAMTVKLFRNSLLAEMDKDYVRTAMIRGNGPWRLLFVHVLRNGLLPVITFLGMAIADLIANSIIVERVFGIPGLGRVLVSSISKQDYPVVEAVTVLAAVVILVVNTAVDLLYHMIDRRIEI